MSVQTESRAASGTRELADRIWDIRRQSAPDNGTSIPSERELAGALGVTRHAVRKAIGLLEEQGRLVRLARRATVPAEVLSHSAREARAVRCLTFIRGSSLLTDPLQWLMQDYLAGYSEALEPYELKTRFVQCPDDCTDYAGLLWPEAPVADQGCILVNRALPGLHRWLAAQRVPYVVQFNHPYDCRHLPPHPRVVVNKAGAGFQATRRLLEQGHRRIGYLGVDPRSLHDTFVYQGFQAAMKVHALSVNPAWIWPVHTDQLAEAIDKTDRYVASASLPTAVVADNDTMALALIAVARRHGLRVPEELSVVGTNDQAEAAAACPPLTTVRIPRRRLARTAVELFMGRLGGDVLRDEIRVIDCELIERASVVAPRDEGEWHLQDRQTQAG